MRDVGDEPPSDFIQAYVQELNKPDSSRISEDWLPHIVFDLFVAGTDTISTTLSWALLLMIEHTDIQHNVQRELDRVLGEGGKGRQVTLADRSSLPYVEAVIMEIQRHDAMTPLALPHSTTTDVEYEGFLLPKDTQIWVNTWETSRDPSLWPDPERFDPQRFLDSDGGIIHHEHWIPFSLGRRMCLGEQLAKQELFLFFVSMLQAFTFSSPRGTRPYIVADEGGISRKPYKYVLCTTSR